MAYTNTANRPNPVAAFASIALPAGAGLLLVTSLTVIGTAPEPDEPFEATNVPITPLPTPEPTADQTLEQRTDPAQTPTVEPRPTYTPAPRPDTEFTFNTDSSGPIGRLPGLGEGLGSIGPVDTGIPDPLPSPTATRDPVAASPRGNPGGWITDSDYRPSWINRNYSGRAGFTLTIDRNGKVDTCRITRSTGHSALDEATCRLLERRATFEPAKDGSGKKVAGTFSSSVNWRIPN